MPEGVAISIEPELVRVNGPRGELTERVPRDMESRRRTATLLVKRPTDRAEHRALHGLTRSLVANMVEGVTTGFEKRLEIQGVGYRAALKGKDLELALGYSHPVPIKAPDGIEFEVPAADAHRGEGHLEAARRRDRREHPQEAAAGALQGQGHPLRGRVRRPEGREARMTVVTKTQARLKRRRRVRAKIVGTAERPRISVFRSNRGIQAQLVDDLAGRTLAACQLDRGRPALAQADGAGRARRASCSPSARRPPASTRVFDRGGYRYHGRVKAFAEGVREGGLTV